MRKTNRFLMRALALTLVGAMSIGGCPVPFSAAPNQVSAAAGDTAEQGVYVLMNIPYEDFYAAEVGTSNNTVKVDGVSSATKAKTKTGTLVGGSYHENSEGDYISGVTFPVLLGEGVTLADLQAKGYTEVTDDDRVEITVTNRGQTNTTTYEGKQALFERSSYSYYQLKEAPSYYKVVTDENGTLTFGAIQGEESTQLDNVTPQFMTTSSYGDYQLNLNGMDNYDTIYGVVIDTQEGYKYGLRHLENIWRTSQLAWCTGFTTKVHNCDTSSEHYASMMGKHINKVTYYTSEGIYEIPIDNIYVPIKFGDYTVSVADANVTAGNTTVTVEGLPEGYTPEYTVANLADAEVTDNTLSFSTAAKPGSYTLQIKDTANTFADISSTFTLYTEITPASYNEEAAALQAAADSSDDDFANYIKNITKVSVNGTDYAASGRGSVQIIKEDGTINQEAAPLNESGTYQITVTAVGYNSDLSFTFVKKDIDTSALEKIIAEAQQLKETDYTAKTWADMQTKLSEALAELAAKDSQTAVDEAASHLKQAIDALVKAQTPTTEAQKTETPTTAAPATEQPAPAVAAVKKGDTYSKGNITYKVTSVAAGKGTVEVTAPKNKKVTSVTIPDTVKINNVTYKVTSISKSAFANCKKLKKVTIGKNVTTIGKNAFKGDSKLKTITVKSKNLKKVGSNAFKNIHKNAKIKVPSSKLKAYKKLLKGKGQGKNVKITK